MGHIKSLFFLIVVIFSTVVLAKSDKGTEFCKTVDANGKVVFAKCIYDPPKPPPPDPGPQPPGPTRPKVDIYYSSWDPLSNKAILFFRENHIVVNAFDIVLDPEAAAKKKKLDPKFVGMPLVIINGVTIRGVDEKKYREALSLKPQ